MTLFVKVVEITSGCKLAGTSKNVRQPIQADISVLPSADLPVGRYSVH